MTFFLRHEHCRETDKHIVGALTAGGLLFMAFQLMVWFEHPAMLFRIAILDSIWMAFNFFNAAFYLTLAHLFTRQRRNHHHSHGAAR
ncbi:hypothetical protein D3C80_1525430 [compost metagenome]